MAAGRLVDAIIRVVREFGGDLPDGVAERVAAEVGRFAVQAVPQQAGEGYALDVLTRAIPPRIIEGLEVKATNPPTDYVYVTAGTAYCYGHIRSIEDDKRLRIPITQRPRQQVWWVVLRHDGGLGVEATRDHLKHVVLAKIVAPYTDCRKIRDTRPENPNTHDAYIVSGRDLLLATGYDVDEYTIDKITDIVKKTRAESIFGKLTVGELLSILSADGSIQISDAIRMYDTDKNMVARWDRNGLYFWDSNGKPLARFTGKEGASRIGGLEVGPNGLVVHDGTSINAADGSEIISSDGIDGDKLDIDWDPTNYTPDTSPSEVDDADDLSAHLAGIDGELKPGGLHLGDGGEIYQWYHSPTGFAKITPTHQSHRIVNNPSPASNRIMYIDPANAKAGDVLTLRFESGYSWTLEHHANGNILPAGGKTSYNEWAYEPKARVCQLVYDGSSWRMVSPGQGVVSSQLFDQDYCMVAANGTAGSPTRVDVDENRIVGRPVGSSIQGLTPSQVRSMINVEDGADVTANHPPQAHAASHQSGGSDAIKLDDLASPDDTTDLDVSTSAHGLCPKAPNDMAKFLRGDATWAVPSSGAIQYLCTTSWTGDGTNNRLIAVADDRDATSFTPDFVIVTRETDAGGNVDHFALAWYLKGSYGAFFVDGSSVDVRNRVGSNVDIYWQGISGTNLYLGSDGTLAKGTNKSGVDYRAVAMKFAT